MTIERLDALTSDRRTVPVTLEVADAAPWTISVRAEGMPAEPFAGTDLFDALTSLRRALEQQGLLLLCAGARPDVHPSGMSRSMGSGRLVNRSDIGKPAEPQPIDIFAPATPDQVDTVDAQIAYRQRWTESLRRIVDDATVS